MFDWDDLRIFLAAARATSFAGASHRVGIDAATISRKVVRLETSLKSTLFTRSRSGLQLTAAGAQLFDIALDAEQAMEAAARVTQPDVVAGTVRISTAEGFGVAVLAPALPGLARQRPGLRVELAAQAGFLSPSRREVDMAITLSAPGGARLIVEPLTTYQLALYASPDYLERHPEPQISEDLRKHEIVGYIEDILYAPELRYLDEVLPGLKPSLASSSIQAQRAVLAAGGGVGVLPCFLADGLVRVLPTEWLLERRFWLSIHRETYGTARGKAIRVWLRHLVGENQKRLNPFGELTSH